MANLQYFGDIAGEYIGFDDLLVRDSCNLCLLGALFVNLRLQFGSVVIAVGIAFALGGGGFGVDFVVIVHGFGSFLKLGKDIAEYRLDLIVELKKTS